MMRSEIQEVLSGSRRWCVIHAPNEEILPTLPDKSVDHAIEDPPYSEHVHGKQRRGSSLPDGRGGDHHGESRGGRACIARVRELGFASVTPAQMAFTAEQRARLVRRWSLTFCDNEIAGDWMRANVVAKLEHIRIGHWIKSGCTPQFTGDRPASGTESIVIAHPKGRKRWNGGGSHAVWMHPIVLNRGGDNPRNHTTEKPLALMVDLIRQFTEPGDLVLDAYCGSGTTGVACVKLGRRFIGVEMSAEYAATARRRIGAELPDDFLSQPIRKARQSSLELPERLPPPEAMHGAADQCGGNDFGEWSDSDV